MATVYSELFKKLVVSLSRNVRLSTVQEFYVYALLDISEPGPWTYTVGGDKQITFSHLPFYVGKGKGYRKSTHVRQALDGKGSTAKAHKIRKIYRNGFEVLDIASRKRYTEAEALAIEVLLIEGIGRRDLNMGPLTNLSEGGEGPSGVKRSKKRIREMTLARQQWFESLTEEQRSDIARKNYAAMPEKVRLERAQKIGNWARSYHEGLTENEKQDRSLSLRLAHQRRSPEEAEALREKLRLSHLHMPEEKKKLRVAKVKAAMTEEKKMARAAKIKAEYAARTPEQKAARAAKISATKLAKRKR